MAQKYLMMVLERSNTSLAAIGDGFVAFKEAEALREHVPNKFSKMAQIASQAVGAI
jgi:hypothetical protein